MIHKKQKESKVFVYFHSRYKRNAISLRDLLLDLGVFAETKEYRDEDERIIPEQRDKAIYRPARFFVSLFYGEWTLEDLETGVEFSWEPKTNIVHIVNSIKETLEANFQKEIIMPEEKETKMNNTVYIVSNSRLNSLAKKLALTLREAKIDCTHCGISGQPLEKHRESAIAENYRFFVPLTDYYDTGLFRMEDLKTGCVDNYDSIDEIFREIEILVNREPVKEIETQKTNDILKPEEVQIGDKIKLTHVVNWDGGKVKSTSSIEFTVAIIEKVEDAIWASYEKYSNPYCLSVAKEIILLERPVKEPVKDKSYEEILEELYTLYNNFSSIDWNNIETYREISNKTMKIIDQYKELE